MRGHNRFACAFYVGFIQQAIGKRDDVVIQPIGGWSELRNPDFPFERLWDGCLDVILIADGDNGRDSESALGRPLSTDGADLLRRLDAIGVSRICASTIRPRKLLHKSRCGCCSRSVLPSLGISPWRMMVLETCPDILRAASETLLPR